MPPSPTHIWCEDFNPSRLLLSSCIFKTEGHSFFICVPSLHFIPFKCYYLVLDSQEHQSKGSRPAEAKGFWQRNTSASGKGWNKRNWGWDSGSVGKCLLGKVTWVWVPEPGQRWKKRKRLYKVILKPPQMHHDMHVCAYTHNTRTHTHARKHAYSHACTPPHHTIIKMNTLV